MKDDKVHFETKYETRTRLVDEAGNFIDEGPAAEAVAPPHPDVEGGNPETVNAGLTSDDDTKGKDKPATANASDDAEKKESAERMQKDGAKPMPASEGNQATK